MVEKKRFCTISSSAVLPMFSLTSSTIWWQSRRAQPSGGVINRDGILLSRYGDDLETQIRVSERECFPLDILSHCDKKSWLSGSKIFENFRFADGKNWLSRAVGTLNFRGL